jgi:hypothetical protein
MVPAIPGADETPLGSRCKQNSPPNLVVLRVVLHHLSQIVEFIYNWCTKGVQAASTPVPVSANFEQNHYVIRRIAQLFAQRSTPCAIIRRVFGNSICGYAQCSLRRFFRSDDGTQHPKRVRGCIVTPFSRDAASIRTLHRQKRVPEAV